MSDQFLGEIRMGGWNFAPVGWAFCNGALQAIAQNDLLSNLIGTTFGGDGQETFALPDLQGRLPIHFGQGSGTSNYALGQAGGLEQVTLNSSQMPVHTHPAVGDGNAGTKNSPLNNYWALSPQVDMFSNASTDTTMLASALPQQGGNQPHENRPPYLAITFVIALQGIYPAQS